MFINDHEIVFTEHVRDRFGAATDPAGRH